MKILKDIKLDIPEDIGREFLTKLMGGRLNPGIEAMLSQSRDISAASLQPSAIYDSFRITGITGDSVNFESGYLFKGPNISKILNGSETAVIFIFTLGKNIDDAVNNLRDKGDTLAAIVMDAVTTSMLGLVGEYVGKSIKAENLVEKGYGSTCTYSPGQYKWTIEEQREIFHMVDGSRIGVNLNDSCLMLPFKSVSGVYGFGPEEKINKTRVACDLCPREDCIGRK